MPNKSPTSDHLKNNHGKKQKFYRINLDHLLDPKQSEYISKKIITDNDENECNEMNNEQRMDPIESKKTLRTKLKL